MRSKTKIKEITEQQQQQQRWQWAGYFRNNAGKRKAIKLLWAKVLELRGYKAKLYLNAPNLFGHVKKNLLDNRLAPSVFGKHCLLTLAPSVRFISSSRCCFVSIKLISFRYTCACSLCVSQLIALRRFTRFSLTRSFFLPCTLRLGICRKLHFSQRFCFHTIHV